MGVPTKVSSKPTVDPQTVAVIMAALAVGGYLSPSSRVAGIKKLSGSMDPWKRSGIVEIMIGRDYSLE
jgi:hypothetical protein